MQFVTGAEEEPVLGFVLHPSLQFVEVTRICLVHPWIYLCLPKTNCLPCMILHFLMLFLVKCNTMKRKGDHFC